MGKDTSRRKKTKRAGRRSKRVKRETPRFPLYRQVGGSLAILTTLPNGNGATNLAAWYDASDPNGTGILPSDGASITTWADKSGNGRDLTKTAGTIYYKSSLTDSTPAFNKHAIDFRTTPGGIFLSSKQFNLSTTFSLYIVGVLKDSTKANPSVNNFAYTTLFGHYPVTSPGTTKDYFVSSNVRNFLNITLYPGTTARGRYAQLERKGGSGGEPLRDPDPSVGWLYYGDAPYILTIRADSLTKVMYKLYKMGVNGPYIKPTPETSTVPSTTTPANITMGISSSGHPSGCYTSEIIYFQETHTDQQADVIESYLAWKWGFQTAAGGVLSSTSPYTTAQPTALSAGEIASAASAATASMAIASGQRASAASAATASMAIALAPRQYTSAYNMLTNLPGTTGGATNLAAWYDASDPNGTGTQPSNGDSITKWVDKSGNGRDLTKTAGTINYRSSLTDSTPTFNQPAIDFRTNPGGIFLSSKQFNLSTTFSLYIVGVLKDRDNNNPSNFFGYTTLFGHYPVTSPGTKANDFNNQSNFLNITLYPGTTDRGRYAQLERPNGTGGEPLRDPDPSVGWLYYGDAPYILTIRADSLTKVMYKLYKMGVNGPYIKPTPETSTVPSTTTPANITMGISSSGHPSGCYTSEIIYFQETHTDQQADVIESYLAWKWGFQTAAGGVLLSSNPYSGMSTLKTITPEESAATASMAIASGQRASAAIASGQIASAQIASAAIASGQIASGQIASGQQASGQIASGQRASAAIASGQIASGQIASGQIASGQIASAAFASGQQYSGAFASGQQASGQQYSGAFASGQIASAAYAIGQKESAAFASGQIASAAYASGQQYSGAFASGQQASGQQYSGAFASGQQYSGAFASGQQASGQQASSALGVKSLGQDPGSGKFLLRLQPL